MSLQKPQGSVCC